MQAIDDYIIFTVEINPSDFTTVATLSHGGRPLIFHSHTFQGSELFDSFFKKERDTSYGTIYKSFYFQ